MIPPRRLPKPTNSAATATVKFGSVEPNVFGHRIVIYGTGGIGKTILACLMPGPVAVADVDESLSKLHPTLDAYQIPVPLIIPATDWMTLRRNLQASGYDSIKSIVLDAWAPIELWCLAYTLATVRKDGGKLADSLEDYGYGKGYRFLFETFLPLLADLDAHVRAGRNVIIVSHDDSARVPNPAGLDFLRWEPKMQHTDKASIRYRIKEWADHVLFLAYDVAINKTDREGKKAGRAVGAGTRTLYTAEQPHFMAKSRTTQDPIEIQFGVSPWGAIIK